MSHNSGVVVVVISNQWPDYSLNCTPLSPIVIVHQSKLPRTLPPRDMWGFISKLAAPYWQLSKSNWQLSDSSVCGDLRVLILMFRGMWGTGREFFLTQNGGLRSYKDFWVHFASCDYSRWRKQVLNGICRIRFIVIQISTAIDLGHGFKKANISIFLLPVNLCFAVLYKKLNLFV